ncbi:MAG: argininosuccinate lyase [Armatimonadota bacterium]|nr:argininosuccinate lyase [Armatimonadota bacterium]
MGEYRTWGGRFEGSLDPMISRFTSSLPFDRRLVRADILGSIAHAMMLGRCGIIGEEEAEALVSGLWTLLEDVEEGRIVVEGAEDIHTFVEGVLRERLGDIAGKLHTARSRNDQVATDLRLYLREEIAAIVKLLLDLEETFLHMAEENFDVIVPGYTHLQRAQPVLLAHHLHAYVEMLNRDIDRLKDCYRRTNVLPLGSGALAGTSFPVDRELIKELLGFEGISANSMDAASDRDFVVEFLAAAALVMVHLSRWAEEVVAWSSQEFGFFRLDDRVCTGSSIMPQKKNPDAAELIRAKAGRVVGALSAMLMVLKGLPLSYHRDLQEDKEVLFDAVETLKACLEAARRVCEGITVDRARIEASLRGGYMTATEVADYLTRKGVPFRIAHEVVGRMVRYAEERGKELWELGLEEYREFSPLFEADVISLATPWGTVQSKRSPGGTAPSRVKEALQEAWRKVEKDRAWLASRPKIKLRSGI